MRGSLRRSDGWGELHASPSCSSDKRYVNSCGTQGRGGLVGSIACIGTSRSSIFVRVERVLRHHASQVKILRHLSSGDLPCNSGGQASDIKWADVGNSKNTERQARHTSRPTEEGVIGDSLRTTSDFKQDDVGNGTSSASKGNQGMSVLTRVVTFSVLFLSAAASAQQPGTPQYNSVYLPGHGVGDARPKAVKWGAWARGDDRQLGYSLEGRSKEEAEALAVADCSARGSKNCVPIDAFHNACVAIAAGPDDRRASINVRGLKWARKQALKTCEGDCQIIFEGCALP
ncbi:DUF4189 domain-containing protein [Stenotrophomonas sp. S41]|nr:DUF4189 domain-containing protein [Stenotrophomonas sp. S41]